MLVLLDSLQEKSRNGSSEGLPNVYSKSVPAFSIWESASTHSCQSDQQLAHTINLRGTAQNRNTETRRSDRQGGCVSRKLLGTELHQSRGHAICKDFLEFIF
jgi:hypothetical protein